MIVDSSAIIAILNGEAEAQDFSARLASAYQPKLTAANYLETSILVDREKNASASKMFDDFLSNYSIKIVPVTEDLARAARAAFNRFGKGMNNKAKLNFGDCFSYALAKEADEPLLFKGDDFIHTDIRDASKL